MPWSVLTELDRTRRRAREPGDRVQGACRQTVTAFIDQASALLRRRDADDRGTVCALITGALYCVPCISMVTQLDARRVYAALERLKAETNVRLHSGRCSRCHRETTVHTIGE